MPTGAKIRWYYIYHQVIIYLLTQELFMITSRICTGCNIEKPFEEFGNCKKGKWGKREQCKPCKRIKDREYERANPDKMTAKHDRWAKKNEAHLAAYRHKRYEENPEPYKKSSIEYRKKNNNEPIKKYKYKYPEKKRAHRYVELAVFYGDLIRPENCSKCGIECAPQGHHHDYDLPLDVIWLCTKCHGFEHRINHAERLNIETPKGEATVQTAEETSRGEIEASFPPCTKIVCGQ